MLSPHTEVSVGELACNCQNQQLACLLWQSSVTLNVTGETGDLW